MADLGPGQRAELRLIDDEQFVHKLAWGFGGVGTAAGIVGVIVGLAMAFHRVVVACPVGHLTPVGGDPNCYSYPNAGLGSAVALISLALCTLIMLVAAMLLVQDAARRRRI
jgi:hypothetical protein